jgi:hypothetical protein
MSKMTFAHALNTLNFKASDTLAEVTKKHADIKTEAATIEAAMKVELELDEHSSMKGDKAGIDKLTGKPLEDAYLMLDKARAEAEKKNASGIVPREDRPIRETWYGTLSKIIKPKRDGERIVSRVKKVPIVLVRFNNPYKSVEDSLWSNDNQMKTLVSAWAEENDIESAKANLNGWIEAHSDVPVAVRVEIAKKGKMIGQRTFVDGKSVYKQVLDDDNKVMKYPEDQVSFLSLEFSPKAEEEVKHAEEQRKIRNQHELDLEDKRGELRKAAELREENAIALKESAIAEADAKGGALKKTIQGFHALVNAGLMTAEMRDDAIRKALGL